MRSRFKTWWSLVVAVTLLAGLAAAPRVAIADDDDDDGAGTTLGYRAGEMVAQLTPYARLSTVQSLYKLSVIDRFGMTLIYRFRILDGQSPDAKAKQMQADSLRIKNAEPNFVDQIPEWKQRASWYRGTQTAYTAQWAPSKLRLSEAHRSARGANVVVAVLDTGIDAAHPAFTGRLTPSATWWDFVDADNAPGEQGSTQATNYGYGHGTHVAGLVALAAPSAKIMPLRVLDENGRGNLWVLAEAIHWAVSRGAHVLTLSLGTLRDSDLIEDLLEEYTCSDVTPDDPCTAAGGRGIVVVASAGNSGTSTLEYPAAESDSGVLAVASTDSYDKLSSFSSRGPWVDVSAPGSAITSAVPGGAYATWSGTSMSAPLAAGVAALVRSSAKYSGLKAADIVLRLRSTGRSIGSGVPKRVDAAAAVAP